MRSKEEAHDYRYFPDPDLMPVLVSEEWKNDIAKTLPELPSKRMERFIDQYKLPKYDSEILTTEKDLADYFEKVVTVTDDFKSASNWIMVDILKVINENKIPVKEFSVSPENIGKLINLINNNTISGKIAKEVFPEMIKSNKDPEEIVKEKNLVQITDTAAIEEVINQILQKNNTEVQQYLSGKEKVFGFFIGQIMKETKGKANPKTVNDLLKQKLEALKN